MKHLILLVALILSPLVKADEGMLLPFQLKDYAKQMKSAGLLLSTKQIYNTKKPSIKDAIVSLGGFCTGEIISPNGLMLTNHHCGYDAIRENSTPENDILTDGFWAMNYKEEKPIPGLTASITVRIEDVTKEIKKSFTEDMDESTRNQIIRSVSDKLTGEAIVGTHYTAEVKSFYEGNEFYLFVYEVFKDIRLVGAPPSAIGKFGGDTDNWMWERHTGDFSMFRIYAGDDNKPADFSKENKPYAPKHHLPISLKGIKKDDFAMIMGFPGSTDRFLTSYGVQMAVEKEQPSRVKVRGEKLAIMKKDMKASDDVRLKYASTYAQVSNYWKYFIGQTEQLKNNKVYEKKKALENEFATWVNEKEKRKARYGNVLNDIDQAYTELEKINDIKVYFFEAIYSIGINQFMIQHTRLYNLLKAEELDEELIAKTAKDLLAGKESFFETFNADTEEKLISSMLELYYENVPTEQHGDVLEKLNERFEGDWGKAVSNTMKKSVFASEKRYTDFMNNPTKAVFEDEMLFLLNQDLLDQYRAIVYGTEAQMAQTKLDEANRLFVEGLRIMNKKTKYYPNANFSLRLSFGNILPYTSNEGKEFPFYTTIDGLMAKEDPNNDEFIVPAKLKELYEKKDFGRYAEDGNLWVNFISNNDITGGNSGSPVMNANGELIGCAFDGNWEAMSGDIAFEDKLQRTISVDIRYVLFVIDKYAGATNLIDEMTIIE
jgi:hypothetical protein